MKTIIRHGDLVFDLIQEIPSEAKKTKNNILAHGEHTGHTHTLTPIKGSIKIWDIPQGKILEVEQEAELTHQEHKPVRFTAGRYRMWYEREWDVFSKEISRVQD